MSGLAYALGRVFIPIIFIVSGIGKFMDVKGIAGMLAGKNFPVPPQIEAYVGLPKYEALGYLVAAIEVIGGLLVLIGWKARWGAVALVIFVAFTIGIAHDFWNMEGADQAANQAQALKNLSIMGGLLLVAAMGSGPYSLDDSGRPG